MHELSQPQHVDIQPSYSANADISSSRNTVPNSYTESGNYPQQYHNHQTITGPPTGILSFLASSVNYFNLS